MLGCDTQQTCQPGADFGFPCASCRMNKCIESGMSLKGLAQLNFPVPMNVLTFLKMCFGVPTVESNI